MTMEIPLHRNTSVLEALQLAYKGVQIADNYRATNPEQRIVVCSIRATTYQNGEVAKMNFVIQCNNKVHPELFDMLRGLVYTHNFGLEGLQC